MMLMVFNVIEIEYNYIKEKNPRFIFFVLLKKKFYFVMQNLWLINVVRDMAKLDEYAIRLNN